MSQYALLAAIGLLVVFLQFLPGHAPDCRGPVAELFVCGEP